MESPCFVATVDPKLAHQIECDLIDKGFEIKRPAYTLFQAKKTGVTVTLYQSGKLTIQGKDKDEIIRYYFEPEILKDFSHTCKEAYVDTRARVGVDEAGKGDFFGPLCVAAVFADEKTIPELVRLGVKDSKSIGDKQIVMLAQQIAAVCPYTVLSLHPPKYNELYASFKNLNSMLAWGHATVIDELTTKTGCASVILDQFAHESLVLRALAKKSQDLSALSVTQRHRGEADIVVAAASILARAAFLKGMDRLSQQAHITLPKGASQAVIAAGRQLVARMGPGALNDFAKMHFKTKEDVLRA